jgi:hypothetical protein
MAWSPAGDELVIDDGRTAHTGESWAFAAYRRHRAVFPLLSRWNLGASDRLAEYALLLDREQNLVRIAPIQAVDAFLRKQWPPAPLGTQEERETTSQQFEDFMAKGWEEVRVDPAEIGRQMAEQRGRISRMMSWLDQCPTPGEGRGP